MIDQNFLDNELRLYQPFLLQEQCNRKLFTQFALYFFIFDNCFRQRYIKMNKVFCCTIIFYILLLITHSALAAQGCQSDAEIQTHTNMVQVGAKATAQVRQLQQNSYSKQQQTKNHATLQPKSVFLFFQQNCFKQHHSNFSFGPSKCYLFILSKILGNIIIVGSLFVRFPQIYIIIKNRSVEGISYFATTQQFLMCSLSVGYPIFLGLPFSVYGQNVFNCIATFLICMSFLSFESCRSKKEMIGVLGFISFISFLFVFQFVPPFFQEVSIWFQIVTIFTARGSQIFENITNGSTGNLSFLTVFLLFIGCAARTTTILIQANNQILLLIGVVSGILLNGALLVQFYVYKDKKKEFKLKSV